MSRGRIALLTGVLLGANVLGHLVTPRASVVLALALVLTMVGIARATGLTTADLGLTRAAWRRGLRWGAAASVVVVVACGLILVVPSLRDRVSPADWTWVAVGVKVLLVVPFLTVVPEELAFRGVCWALLRSAYRQRAATLVSSALFGLWHVLPALGGGPANATAAGTLGEGATGLVTRVAGTVLVTFLAGVLLSALRSASGSLLAPVILHWAANSAGILLVQLA